MRLLDYLKQTKFEENIQSEQACLLLYYRQKEMEVQTFEDNDIKRLFSDAGKSQQINAGRIRKRLINEEKIRLMENTKKTYEFVPVYKQKLDDLYDKLWLGYEFIDSNSEVINEERYCGKRDAIDKIIKQINCCYAQHCFDGCCVLMRRLFEMLLITAFKNQGIEDKIKDEKGCFKMLNDIVAIAKQDKTLSLTRNKNKYDLFRDIGNYSAHNQYYIATVKEIDDIKLDFKAMMDEPYQKAGLFK